MRSVVIPPVAVVIPAWNAAGSIGYVVHGVRSQAPDVPVTVVDDGSTDGTGQEADSAGAKVLTHAANRGKGAALKTGYRAAFENGAEWVVTLDADGQHHPAQLAGFLEAIGCGRWDLLLGRRVERAGTMPWQRRLSNAMTSRLVSWRIGVRVQDAQCGYRAMHRQVFDNIPVYSDGFMTESEWLLRAGICGFRIGHIPVDTLYENQHSAIAPVADTLRFAALYAKSWLLI